MADRRALPVPGTVHALSFEPVLEPFVPEPAPACAAVDGSHAVLVDNGHMFMVAFRATAVPWPGPTPHPRIEVATTTADRAQHEIESLYAARGLPAPKVRSAEGFAEARRGLAELDACLRAADGLPRGGLLLVDGALEQLPEAAQAMADRIVERGRARSVHVVGISKRSGLSVQGIAVVPALLAHGKSQQPGTRWHAAVPGHGACVALLHPRARHAFRVDGAVHALPWLADLSRDAVYLGYPYPLAKAHNRVAITHKEARRLAEVVRRTSDQPEWLDDFHAVLDRNAPR